MAWLFRVELERQLDEISHDLERAKHNKYLANSLDMNYVYTYWEAPFSFYYNRGSKYLINQIKKHTHDEKYYYSNFLKSAMQACIIDDVNLAHVMNIVRMEELIEGYMCDISITLLAKILIAILGELDAALENCEIDESLDNPNETYNFLNKLINNLTLFIIESGRDRATYIKEAIISPPLTPPRPSHSHSDALQWKRDVIVDENDLMSLSKEFEKDLDKSHLQINENIQLKYKRADPVLESLLLSGSLCSLRQRLLFLFSENNYNTQLVIKWSLIRQLPRLNRARQLIFTRLLQVFATASWDISLLKSNKNVKQVQNILKTASCSHPIADYKRRQLFKFLVDTFLESGIRIWCYEDISQKIDLLKTDVISLEKAQKLFSILCLQIPRSVTEIPINDNIPDMETLASMFSEWKMEDSLSLYTPLNITDMNLFKKIPDDYERGYTATPSRTITIGPRFHMGVPDIAMNGELRFFSNPLITSLINNKQFSDTLNFFLDKKYGDIENNDV